MSNKKYFYMENNTFNGNFENTIISYNFDSLTHFQKTKRTYYTVVVVGFAFIQERVSFFNKDQFVCLSDKMYITYNLDVSAQY